MLIYLFYYVRERTADKFPPAESPNNRVVTPVNTWTLKLILKTLQEFYLALQSFRDHP
jgi:hypothetical protein